MKKVKISLNDLFDFVGASDAPVDEIVNNNHEIYIKTPYGDYVKILGFIRKIDTKIKLEFTDSTKSFICGEHHKLIDHSGNEIYAKDCKIIQSIDGLKEVKTKQKIESGLVYDIALPAPHLYVTPNGIIHHNTTVSRAIANELGADILFINASLESGIDAIRTKVVQFSSSVSFTGGPKIVVFDEADGITQAAQNSIRGVIEEFSSTRFFFTCNFKNRIIDAIQSRCANIDFKIDKEEKPKVAAKFFKRVATILKQENVEFDPKVVAALVEKFFPDFRRTLNELQRYSSSGKIDSGILTDNSKEDFRDLMSALKNKKFNDMRKWVGQHSDMDVTQLFREFYDNANDLFEPKCIPTIILLLADYSFKATQVVDQEILIAAAMTEIMMNATWK